MTYLLFHWISVLCSVPLVILAGPFFFIFLLTSYPWELKGPTINDFKNNQLTFVLQDQCKSGTPLVEFAESE